MQESWNPGSSPPATARAYNSPARWAVAISNGRTRSEKSFRMPPIQPASALPFRLEPIARRWEAPYCSSAIVITLRKLRSATRLSQVLASLASTPVSGEPSETTLVSSRNNSLLVEERHRPHPVPLRSDFLPFFGAERESREILAKALPLSA